MWRGGLTATDGEDYRLSDCEADRQLGGEGLISELLIHQHMLHSREAGGREEEEAPVSLSGQLSLPVYTCMVLSPTCITSSTVVMLDRQGWTHSILLLLHLLSSCEIQQLTGKKNGTRQFP